MVKFTKSSANHYYGGRQRRTACPLLCRYRLIHTFCSLARLPPTVYLLTLSSARPFSNGIFRSDSAPASLHTSSSSLTHTLRMSGFCNQNADQLGSLAGLCFLTVYVGAVECAPYTHTPPPHTCFPMSAHLSRLRLFQ